MIPELRQSKSRSATPYAATSPGRFRSRVITRGVIPSLYADCKKTRIKRYHNEGQALRTETTINYTRLSDRSRLRGSHTIAPSGAVTTTPRSNS